MLFICYHLKSVEGGAFSILVRSVAFEIHIYYFLCHIFWWFQMRNRQQVNGLRQPYFHAGGLVGFLAHELDDVMLFGRDYLMTTFRPL